MQRKYFILGTYSTLPEVNVHDINAIKKVYTTKTNKYSILNLKATRVSLLDMIIVHLQNKIYYKWAILTTIPTVLKNSVYTFLKIPTLKRCSNKLSYKFYISEYGVNRYNSSQKRIQY